MTVFELNHDQRVTLKQSMLCKRMEPASPSYGELAFADELISDEDMLAEFAGTEFSEDDFLGSGNNAEGSGDDMLADFVGPESGEVDFMM